ncbi:class I SAM-dependent rRNA methyltransferase [Alkalihalobacterium bogoriense]|uniref:class I SAM-dependent rRNA methyltransferase n=1 Tax=Alkalihalobacterium bogoriense TaxID=246272 RepID=UPI00047CCFA9|nr:class I SAM-dependent rRNA methyltransferase [Alkalihalobacterium bogoriense]
MKNEITVKVKPRFIKKYKSGFPLIMKEAIDSKGQEMKEGMIVTLVDAQHSFIGKGYVGKQNKGFGWIITKNPEEAINNVFFKRKLEQAFVKRKSMFIDEETNAYRIFNGEGDGIGGLIIDFYDGYYVIHWYSEGIYAFQKEIVEAILQQVNCKGIYEKKRFNTGGHYIDGDDFVDGTPAQFPLIVKENGVNIAVDLNDGAMVGVFLDQRDVRFQIRKTYAKDKEVLNTFSYTGVFSVAAAIGGARKTTSVDLAKRSLPKTIEQFSVNDIDYEEHDIIVEDVFAYFKYAKRKEKKFDLIVLDPPSFARSKQRRFSVATDYTALLEEVLAITNENGMVVASTNYSGFGMEKFKGFINEACQNQKRKYSIVDQYSLPKDFKTHPQFKEGNYLKVVFIQLKN